MKSFFNGNNLIILKRYSLESKLIREFNHRNKEISIEQIDDIYEKLKAFANGDNASGATTIFQKEILGPF